MTTIEQEEKRFGILVDRFVQMWRNYIHLRIMRSDDGFYNAKAFIGSIEDDYEVCVAYKCDGILQALTRLNNAIEARLNGKVE
jgi:hypothetical protein